MLPLDKIVDFNDNVYEVTQAVIKQASKIELISAYNRKKAEVERKEEVDNILLELETELKKSFTEEEIKAFSFLLKENNDKIMTSSLDLVFNKKIGYGYKKE